MSHIFSAKLGDLFPADDEASAWLFALAAIRDDLGYEVQRLRESTDQWEKGYFFRRMTISLSEAVTILERHITDVEFERITGVAAKDSTPLKELRQAVKEAKLALREIRHRVGGHMAPSNAISGQPAPPDDAMKGHLRTHAAWESPLALGSELGDTSFQNFTMLTVLFAWPDVVDEATLMARISTSIAQVATLGGLMTRAIENLLASFWIQRGILKQKE